MKEVNFYNLILAFLILAFAAGGVQAQQFSVSKDGDNPPPPRPNLLQELNLSPAQIQQMRRLNQERKQEMQAAQFRLREANRALDEAVYANAEDEAEIQNRIKEVQAAHAEMIRNRTHLERAIRRILTPQQLARFRQLRDQFKQRENSADPLENRRQRLKNLPKNFPRRRQNQMNRQN